MEAAGRSFAELLRELRRRAALSQEELAQRSGLTVKAIGALERGERTRPYPHTVRALADALQPDPAARAALIAAAPSRRAATPVETERRPHHPGQPVDRDQPSGAIGDRPARTGEPGFLRPLTGPPIGREVELTELTALLGAGRNRLVTLVGPGGVGKTTLAIELAARLAEAYPGGPVVVELAALTAADLVLPAIARAFGLPETGDPEAATAVIARLGDRRALLVLDNLEHLLSAAPAIAEILAGCPGLVVLATSRAPLRLRGERVVAVEPLPVPVSDDLAAIASSAAVQVFLRRAELVGGTASVEIDPPVVAEICRRLEGLPLALELAAAQTRMLSPSELIARLDRLRTSAGPRDLPDRQRSLDATLDWSLELLDDEQQGLFARLGVFGGGFTLAAVEAVLGDDPDVLDGLQVLLDHALVSRTIGPAGQSRFRLLEPIRDYAAARLADLGQEIVDGTRDRHARHFAELADGLRPALHDSRLVTALDLLDADQANVRLAVERLLATRQYAEVAQLVWSLWLGLALRGHAREARGWLAALPDRGLPARSVAQARVSGAGLGLVGGNLTEMAAQAGLARVAAVSLDAGDELRAEIDLVTALGAIFDGRTALAKPVLERLIQDTVSHPDLAWHHAHAVASLAQADLAEGDLGSARTGLIAAEAAARALGNPFTLATVLNIRGTLEELAGDRAATARAVLEAVRLGLAARMGWTLAYSLAAAAGVAAAAGELVVAAELFGAVASLSASHEVDPRFAASAALAEGALTGVRRGLGPAAYAQAWSNGRTASLDQLGALIDRLSARVRPD